MHLFGFVVLHAWALCVCCFQFRKRNPLNPNNNINNNNEEVAPVPTVDTFDELKSAEPGICTSLRLAHAQLCFHATTYDEGLEGNHDLRAKCFNISLFQTDVLHPLALSLFLCLVLPWFCCKMDTILGGWTAMDEAALFRSAFATQAVVLVILSSKSLVTQSFIKLHDSVRDERYLVGKELKDMVR
jgi:E3 ubiquitin-protein ligase MARCH6